MNSVVLGQVLVVVTALLLGKYARSKKPEMQSVVVRQGPSKRHPRRADD
ncbi:MAG: hypothetical protein M1118_06655 [Chloroflexi bacterium]|nr:hypothetical protein [Chloroflexota bacterium]